MNGRIYDPLLGRFLSADTLVDGVGSLQGYNRYSYVKNNPLTLTDPSGFTGFLMGAYYGAPQQVHLNATEAKRREIELSSQKLNEKLTVGHAAIATGYAATAYVATVGTSVAVSEAGRELLDEAIDQGVERTTGVPLPATSIIDIGQKLLKEGMQWLFKRGAKEGAEAASDATATAAKNVDTTPTPDVQTAAPTTPPPSATGDLNTVEAPSAKPDAVPGSSPGAQRSVQEAADSVGLDLSKVTVADGVAKGTIDFSATLSPADIGKLKTALKEQGATSARIESGLIGNTKLDGFLSKRVEDGKKFHGATVKRSTTKGSDYVLEFDEL